MHGLRGGLVAYLHEAQGEIVGLLLNADLVEDVKGIPTTDRCRTLTEAAKEQIKIV